METTIDTRESAPRPDKRYERRGLDVAIAIAGLLVLLVSSVIVEAGLSSWEAQLFRWLNELPAGIYTVIYPFMQYGTFITIPSSRSSLSSAATGASRSCSSCPGSGSTCWRRS